jgi:Na+/H+-dicarboxylate symporter
MEQYEESWKTLKKKQEHKGCCDTRCGKCFRSNILLLLLFFSLVGGIAMGALLKIYGPEFTDRELIYFRFPGDLLMRMLKCLIIPLITSSLIAGLGGLDTRASGKMGLYAVIYYMTTTLLAVMLGILLVRKHDLIIEIL